MGVVVIAFLRITRIIKSLHIFGYHDEARAYYAQLMSIVNDFGRINQKSVAFWREASEYDPLE